MSGEFLYEFLSEIHGEKCFEIRFIPEGEFGRNVSFMRSGDRFYLKTTDGLTTPYGFTPNGVWSLCIDYFVMTNSSIFFTVNSPDFSRMTSCVTTDQDILNGGNINCQIVDMDAPEGIRNNKEFLAEWKEMKRKQILSFGLRPSCVVETKHGYHVYWFLVDGQKQLFRHIQMQLIQLFDGDERCLNESRLMRLPRFPHQKDRKDTFPVFEVLWEPENRYSQIELKQQLPELEETTIQKIVSKLNKFEAAYMSESRKNRLLELLIEKLSMVRSTDQKVITHCCMPVHPDRHPSAWIDTEYMWYHCSGCGSHLAIDELAAEFDWQDVILELERYDTDIDAELDRIKAVKTDAPSLYKTSTHAQEKLAIAVITQVLSHFESMGQKVNEKHERYIRDLVTIMVGGEGDKSYLVPLDMGGGKSTIIQYFLAEFFRTNHNQGAIVAVERNVSAKKVVYEVNTLLGKEVAYAMYGFDPVECIWNQREYKELNYCAARSHPYRCPYKKECRYNLQFESQKKLPIVVMTFKRLHLDLDKLQQKYQSFKYDGEKGIRGTLLIDEKPFLSNVDILHEEQFKRHAKRLYENLVVHDGNASITEEIKHVLSLIKPLFTSSSQREIILPLDHEFSFSPEFWSLHNKLYYYSQEVYRMPEVFESIVRNGGHRTVSSKGNIVVATSNSSNYSDLPAFRTFIFDGTADIDLDYNHEQFRLLNFEPLRTYEGLEFFVCNNVSASMTSFQDTSKVSALCEDVKRISVDHPNEIIYFPVFKRIKKQVIDLLHEEIEAGKIIVAHFGETRGSNNYRNYSIVIIGGILHKGEDFYIEKAKAIYNQRGVTFEDVESSKVGNVRRFNEKLIEQVKIMSMIVDYSQEIKRTSQRDNTRNVQGKVFIFHNDKILLERIGMKFPCCKMTNWAPRNIVESTIRGKKNNGNQQAFMELLNEFRESGKFEISYEEIGQRLNISDGARNKLLNSKRIKALLTAYNVRSDKTGRSKRLWWDR